MVMRMFVPDKSMFFGDGIIEQDINGKYIFIYLHFLENYILDLRYYTSCEKIVDFCAEQIEKSAQYKIIASLNTN